MVLTSLCALGVLLASPADHSASIPDAALPASAAAQPSRATVTAAPTADTHAASLLAGGQRTLGGYFARVSYAAQAEPHAPSVVTVRLDHLRGQSPRRVYRRYRLLESVKGGPWQVVERHAATGQRTVRFHATAPARTGGWRLRFELLRPARLPSILTAPVRIAVRAPAPEVVDPGSPDDWTSISGTNPDGSVVRWDPCSPIRWTFNANGTEGHYPQALDDVTASIARISAVTGLTFTYVGPSAVVPYASTGGDMHPVDDSTPDLFIAFAAQDQVPLFTQGTIGLGGPAYYRTATDKTRWIDTGGVVLNTALLNAMPTVNTASRVVLRSLIAHEVLHAVGLGHASGEQQIMYPYIRESETFGAGDLTGMTMHGATHGCAVGFPARTTP